MKIAFIGTGVMGASLVRHLLDAGHEVHLYTRTRSKAEPLIQRGAQWHGDAGSAAAAAETVFTMVGFPEDVKSVYCDPGFGILANAQSGALLVDLTTSTPALAREIAEKAEAGGLAALDAPVSGGDVGARNGKLVIMVGGPEEAYQRALPLLKLFGENIHLHGGPGTGQHCKMANQIAVAAAMVGWSEALGYARHAGLDEAAVLKSISGGAAGSWTMTNLAPRALKEDYAPGFYVKHIVKDLRIALEAARDMQIDLPGLAQAHKLYKRLESEGYADEGTQALFRLYRSDP